MQKLAARAGRQPPATPEPRVGTSLRVLRAGRAGRAAARYVAVVCALDGIRLVEIGDTRAVVLGRLAEYVRRQAASRLWPDDALRVYGLLARRKLEAAVRHYFAAPARWDEEWLYRGAIGALLGVSRDSTEPR